MFSLFTSLLIIVFLFSFTCSSYAGILLPSQTFVRECPKKNDRGFQTGVFIGVFFANKYTAAFYNGYGYNVEGEKNDFWNVDWEKSSFMYRKIIWEYGGGNGQTADLIAKELGVNPGEWKFDESDMPQKMKYSVAFSFGTQLLYAFSKKDALLLNVHAAKIAANGNFTIVLTNPPVGPAPPDYENIKTFPIYGAEQRLMFQLGYRKILGDAEGLNFFVEGGASMNMTKFYKNYITIGSLQIDLSTYYTYPNYSTYHAKFLSGTGFGAFAGLGLNLRANSRWDIQIIYLPSYEKINIGSEPKNKLQNEIGMRVVYRVK